MGQLASTAAGDRNQTDRTNSGFTAPAIPMQGTDIPDDATSDDFADYSSNIPDECLACIFQSLSSGDRKRCSLVSRRWFRVEGQSRNRLSLHAQAELTAAVPSIFSRFDSVTKLALKCDRRSVSIGDDALVFISLRCPNLTRLKLRCCRDLTDAGIEAFAKNCLSLKKLSCGSCTFGAEGMNALLDNCSLLEELSVKRLRGIANGAMAKPIGPGAAAASLRIICLKELYNGQCFGPLIIGSKNLKTLKLLRCSGDWDNLLESISSQAIVELHVERLQVSDAGLTAISNFSNLEILHLVKTPECTNLGLKVVAQHCKLLRKLHIDGWKTNRISDEGLLAVADHCPSLQELVLIGVNPTLISLEKLASKCPKIERLALCGSETVGDPELTCIANKCIALKKLCIKGCPVSNLGMEALGYGCPNLVKVKVKKCRLVTPEVADWLRGCRSSLAINLDSIVVVVNQEIAASDDGLSEASQENRQAHGGGGPSITRSSNSLRERLGMLTWRNFGSCTFRSWLSFGGSSRNNN